jgi:peptidoglycan/xylan/chitin deacetylase (PgdA/CDA1 family)
VKKTEDQMYFLMTNDVESFSIPLNRLDDSTIQKVYEVGLPRLLDLYARHDIKCTFYYTGMFAERSPEAIELVKGHGHEIACHGYDHSPEKAFDVLGYEEQVNELKTAKRVIEKVAGRIESFRAPMLRINEATVKALEKTGFHSDSSVASQRFDGPLTFGSKKKLKWLIAPRQPYMLSYDSVVKPGTSNVLEIPISAVIVPFIGTTMRISPFITKIIQKYLYYESKRTDKPIVFLFHPNECLDIDGNIIATRRTNNFVEYLFADIIRHKLKLKNLGVASLKLLDGILTNARDCGFEFTSVNEYTKMYKTNH